VPVYASRVNGRESLTAWRGEPDGCDARGVPALITRLAERGIHLKAIAELAGHAASRHLRRNQSGATGEDPVRW
jgi:hypothetical protein